MTSRFYHLLANNLVANITNYTVWFALTFYVYLETRSVFATGMIAGVYLVFTAASGFWFGSLVDHHRKKLVMLGSSVASFAFYALAYVAYELAPEGSLADVSGVWLWLLVFLSMVGVIAGNIRSIALPTLVTLLIAEDRRDRANGLVGMVTGIGFLTTSVISGFLVAWGGMHYTLLLALAVTLLAFLHLVPVKIDESRGAPSADAPAEPRRVDIR
ncbi:MAG TPA: MFS transporter, partial [Phenylobacterium sp.]|nr:MFS transporter [Phenylobacterium sp.]